MNFKIFALFAINILFLIFVRAGSSDESSRSKSSASKYKISHKVIEKGAFSIVYLGERVADGRRVAIKVAEDDDNIHYLKREVKTLDLLQSVEGAVHMIDWFELPPNRFCMVMELMSMDLFDYVRIFREQNEDPKKLVDVMKRVSRDILKALVGLRQLNMVHVDVKPENILYDNESGSFKLADFGLSLSARRYESMLPNKFAGTKTYLAPEVLAYALYGYPSDIWALGCTLLNLFQNDAVFDADKLTLPDIPEKWETWLGEMPRHLNARLALERLGYKFLRRQASLPRLFEIAKTDQNFYDFLSGLLNYDRRARLTPEVALEHPFLR